ncbi:phosphatidylserine decarboxylase-domain-containing protein [Phellopilus nigrolimitatus]|nr:phosphatidylserine decarboxylase-domain-containing protein [Phellopilus nigrolimitatus]
MAALALAKALNTAGPNILAGDNNVSNKSAVKNRKKRNVNVETTSPAVAADGARKDPEPSTSGKWAKILRPSAYREHLGLADSLRLAVTNSGMPSSVLVGETSLALATNHSWLRHLFSADTLDKLFATEHLGNYVLVRATGEIVFESMPIYARIGMHLLFYGSFQIRILRWRAIRRILKSESIRQGKIYDSTEPDVVRTQIASFVETYHINLSELAQPDLRAYKTFNEFFSRRLRPGARPSASSNDPSVIVSAADCRLTVWPTWDVARRLWVKGQQFTLQNLVGSRSLARALGPHPALAIFRLAPQDYHRFHTPVSGTLASITHIPGQYYTVNPQAINERLDILTANTRSVAVLHAYTVNKRNGEMKKKEFLVLVIAVGALLVGSIGWDKKEGERVRKGDGLGYFQYGGSTVICVFPAGLQWDTDLLKSSEDGVEVLVNAGERIGRFQ